MIKLGVNIDHVATIRQARLTVEPDPVWAATLAELGGADGITVHLREDRRHIQERDVRVLRETVRSKLNLEMAIDEEVTQLAVDILPDQCTLVPEKREELTTEGGLDVVGHEDRVRRCVDQLLESGIEVSLFIDPDLRQIEMADRLNVHAVELHTGQYADSSDVEAQSQELDLLIQASEEAAQRGLILNMGHGLTYQNVVPIAEIPQLHELNIGHSIISRAIFVGMERAVREMKALLNPTVPISME